MFILYLSTLSPWGICREGYVSNEDLALVPEEGDARCFTPTEVRKLTERVLALADADEYTIRRLEISSIAPNRIPQRSPVKV
jgi:hypothetical protein